MGKSRRNRIGTAHRNDPVGNRPRPVKAPSDPELAALRNDKILPVVKDLRSAEPKTRTTAAGAIANIVEDAKCRKLLLREQVVHILLSETLADSSIESRAAGWEILNLLAQYEESDFCVHLFRCDVLTPTAHALKQVLETLQSTEQLFSKLTKAQQEFVWRITLSICDLVGQLAEARDEILQAIIGNDTITRAFFALVANSASPFEVQWAALVCLARLCDDQRALCQAVVDDTASGCFQVLVRFQKAGGPLGVAACSLLHSVFTTLEWFDHTPGREGASDAVLVPVLAKAVEQQLQAVLDGKKDGQSTEILSQALQTLAVIGTTLQKSLEKGNRDEAALEGSRGPRHANGNANKDDDDHDSDADNVFDDDADMMDGHDEDSTSRGKEKRNGKKARNEAGMDLDDEADADDMDMDMDRDMENVMGTDDNDTEVAGLDDLPTLRELIGTAIPQILRLIQARLRETDEDEVALRLDALSALNNIAWTVSCIDLNDEGNAGILQSWKSAARSIWTEAVRPLLAQDTVDLQVAAKTAGLAWALSRVLRGETPVDAGEPDRFITLRESAAKSADKSGPEVNDDDQDGGDPFQSLGVMCIGVLGQMAQDPAPPELNRKISRYFLDVVDALPTTPAAEAVEAFNQLFDMYGDEAAACDQQVFWADHLLGRFETSVPNIKTMAKSIDKRTRAELRTRADEVVLNLGRFIQYKKKHAPR